MVPKAKVHHSSNLLNEWPTVESSPLLDNAVVKLHIGVFSVGSLDTANIVGEKADTQCAILAHFGPF